MIKLIINNLNKFNAEYHDTNGKLKLLEPENYNLIKNHNWIKDYESMTSYQRVYVCSTCNLELIYYSKYRKNADKLGWGVWVRNDDLVLGCNDRLMIKTCG